MNRMKKCISLILALCIGTYGLPVFAMVAPDAVKTALSDEALAEAMGGNYEARILTRMSGSKSVTVQALFTNMGGTYSDGTVSTGGGCNAAYRFEVLDSVGNVLQTLATGTVTIGSIKMVDGVVAQANNVVTNRLRATMYCADIPALRAEATSQRI